MLYYDLDQIQKYINMLRGFQEVLQVQLVDILHFCLMQQTKFNMLRMKKHAPLGRNQKYFKHYNKTKIKRHRNRWCHAWPNSIISVNWEKRKMDWSKSDTVPLAIHNVNGWTERKFLVQQLWMSQLWQAQYSKHKRTEKSQHVTFQMDTSIQKLRDKTRIT